ncbi:MAG: PCMD domain-containing protein [Muribaculaceae bacterium]|nr:PCMD domain-containing protein [Muribaculaceae bacterium]
MKRFLVFILTAVSLLSPLQGQELRLEKIKFGDMNQWVTREIKESIIIGGNTKKLYEIAPNMEYNGARAYINMGGSPWASSNVYAKVAGIVKTSNAVWREERSPGDYCCKMETVMENVKALGVINMDVMVSGSIFLGVVFEPISSTRSPYSKMEMGIPYTKRPDYLVYDYKVYVPADGQRVYSSGLGPKKKLPGQDYAEVYVLLQKRWEDADGNLHAYRVGTGRERYARTCKEWQNGHKLEIHYGDITNKPFYKAFMGLIPEERAYYARNSKGKMVPVVEEGWANPDEIPTHVQVMASSGCGVAFEGTEGMALWIDNIAFGFK